MKLSSAYYTGSGSNWTLNRTETYSYDPNLDYLTGANYDDGLPNATPSWSYDAAANRTDSIVDNLNRTTAVGGVATTSDILGDRLTMGANTYRWDSLRRITSFNSDSYSYRSDGLRVSKTVGSTTSIYSYDGQTSFEDQDGTGSSIVLNDYGIGARGIDYIARYASGVTTVGFPIYDAHGSMTACLSRSGTSYSVSSQRSYDAWGNVRQGASTGDPKGRYCAALGHKQDDESGLIYMKARYYGRFLSEDVSRKGLNWFAYANNNPVQNADENGKDAVDWLLFAMGILLAVGAFFMPENAACGGGAALAVIVLAKALMDGLEKAAILRVADEQTRQTLMAMNQELNSLPDTGLARIAVDELLVVSGEEEGTIIATEMDGTYSDGGGI